MAQTLTEKERVFWVGYAQRCYERAFSFLAINVTPCPLRMSESTLFLIKLEVNGSCEFDHLLVDIIP
jgi:hypothetical protein